MRWDAFREACPEIAGLAEERFRADELVLLGTIRPDGSPRISPCEIDFAADRLLLGMMWRSRKAQDIARDPRVAVHSVPSDRFNPGGDVKLYGAVVDERDPGVREAFREAIRARIDWAPDEPNYHLYSLDVRQAGYTRFSEEGSFMLAWDPERGLRRREIEQ
ncbi:MAG TPA: pyridoxamine 5'-phosphate oxidase family protein [Actinomycetota bacterium]